MAGRRRLPVIPIETLLVEDDVRDFLLCRASAMSVERAEHSALAGPLLGRQTRVGRDGAPVQGRKEAVNRFYPIEAVDAERYGGYRCGAALDDVVDNLDALIVRQRKTEKVATVADRRRAAPWEEKRVIFSVTEVAWRFDQYDNARVMEREPENRSFRRRLQRVYREIAVPSAAGSARSRRSERRVQSRMLRSPHRKHHCGAAIPRPDRMASVCPDGRIQPTSAM